MLAALLPVRDNRDRVTAYELSTYPLTGVPGTNSADDDAHATLELLSTLPLPRLTGGRSVHVPVTPTLLREGALSRFASVDAVFVIATQALEDQTTRRTVERLIASGFRFGLDGFPEGVDAIPPSLAGATIALDAGRVSALTMASRVQSLLHVGLKPIVRSVDDRATRERVLSQGVPYYTGRIMLRGAMRDADSESSVKRAVTMLTAFSDGRPPDATFDVFVRNNARLSAELVHMMRSSTMGVRLPRTAENALTVLGFDAVLERAAALVARMAGDAAGDAELALIGLRRARACERLAAGLERGAAQSCPCACGAYHGARCGVRHSGHCGAYANRADSCAQ